MLFIASIILSTLSQGFGCGAGYSQSSDSGHGHSHAHEASPPRAVAKQSKPSGPIPFSETQSIIDELIGPLGRDGVTRLRSTGGSIRSAEELTCSFDAACCWQNIAGGSDDLDWGLVQGRPDPDKAAAALNSDVLPSPPFAATGARRTHSFVYAFLVSCPVLCQRSEGRLELDQWATPGVTIDVCTLPVDQRNFTYCQTLTRRSPARQDVIIPPQKEPFVIVVVASEFTRSPGGMAAVDNIRYSGDICDGDDSDDRETKLDGSGGTSQRDYESSEELDFVAAAGGPPLPPASEELDFKEEPQEYDDFDRYDDICAALDCDLNTEERKETCGYACPDAASCFVQRRKRTGNYAAGVSIVERNQKYYLGARLRPNRTAVMETPSFHISEDMQIEVDYFEAAHDVSLEACLDDMADSSKCTILSQRGVKPGDRKWRTKAFRVPRGTHRVFFAGRNVGQNQASVGVSRPRILTADGRQVLCSERALDDDPLLA